jgi:hypothetical protein
MGFFTKDLGSSQAFKVFSPEDNTPEDTTREDITPEDTLEDGLDSLYHLFSLANQLEVQEAILEDILEFILEGILEQEDGLGLEVALVDGPEQEEVLEVGQQHQLTHPPQQGLPGLNHHQLPLPGLHHLPQNPQKPLLLHL